LYNLYIGKQDIERVSMFSRKEIRLESLQAQVNHLSFVRARHETWATEMHNPEIRLLHSQVVDLLEQTLDRCNRLLDEYNKPTE
jgi:hypothetical protein